MKNQITVEISDDLTPQQEILAIAKALSKKNLRGPVGSMKAVGNARLEMKYGEQTIIIRRISKEPVLKTKVCHCGTIFEERTGKRYYHNYGGIVKPVHACSVACAEAAVDMIGPRASMDKRKLSNAFLYR